MKKGVALIATLLVMFLSIGDAIAGRSDAEIDKLIYGNKHYDKYRNIRYWARASISINDYDYDSGDAAYFKLTSKTNDDISEEVNSEIKEYFLIEFKKNVASGLPFHDENVGYKERFNKFLNDNSKDINFIEKWNAYEEARRMSSYGDNPAAIYCNIKIKRRDFPVLYEIETSVIANKDLRNYGTDLKESSIGYSTPDFIYGELRRAISMQIHNLAEKMAKIRKFRRE